MSDKHASDGASTIASSLASASGGEQVMDAVAKPGFIRRYRLPLFLAVLAICLYAGSILYILYGRGQVA